MQADTLSGGFATPATDAARAFRAVMEAMARPGTRQTTTGAMPPSAISPAAGAVLLTLCDTDTPLYLAGPADCDALRSWIAFHTGAPLVGPEACTFALGPWEALLPLSTYSVGTSEYPDRSATLIIDHPAWQGRDAILHGPGIKDQTVFPLPDPPAFQTNSAMFPLCLDFMFTCGDQIAALPRSTRVS